MPAEVELPFAAVQLIADLLTVVYVALRLRLYVVEGYRGDSSS